MLIHTRRCTCSCWLAKGDGRGTGPEQATAAALALAAQDRMLALCALLRLARRASSDVGELSLPCAPSGSPLCPVGLHSMTLSATCVIVQLSRLIEQGSQETAEQQHLLLPWPFKHRCCQVVACCV